MNKSNHRKNGAIMPWAIVTLIGLIAVSALGLDWARVSLVQTEMQRAADSIALAAAGRLAGGTTVATSAANQARLANLADNKEIYMSRLDFSDWDSTNGQYTKVTVELLRDANHGGVVPLALGQAVGMSGKSVAVRSTAKVLPEIFVEQDVLGSANPFLAGMPKGSVASVNNPARNPDYAGDVNSRNPSKWKQSPRPITGLPLIAGQSLTFDNIAGTTKHGPDLPMYEPDGQTGENGVGRSIGHNTAGSENGIADATVPINALVGVFLGPDRPDNTSAPSKLNFSTSASRNQQRYEPQLKQIFFIGDGRAWVVDENGQQVEVAQEFIVPQGATRLYLATWDFYEWNNNGGERTIEIKRPKKITLVE
ncbi:MAG: hypothetical protein IT448_04810 [Phycisphaerales bacterium]|nr:hypothetical protein [Phycisphaerales bacterium]